MFKYEIAEAITLEEFLRAKIESLGLAQHSCYRVQSRPSCPLKKGACNDLGTRQGV